MVIRVHISKDRQHNVFTWFGLIQWTSNQGIQSFRNCFVPRRPYWMSNWNEISRAHATGQFGRRSRLLRIYFAFLLIKSEVFLPRVIYKNVDIMFISKWFSCKVMHFGLKKISFHSITNKNCAMWKGMQSCTMPWDMYIFQPNFDLFFLIPMT